MLACAKGVAGLKWAEQAKVISLDANGIDLEVSGSGHLQTVRIDFPASAKGVPAFQRIVGTLIAEGRNTFGWAIATNEH